MGWFSWGPEDKLRRIPDAVNRWWDSIKGQPLEETIVDDVRVTVILCPSPEAMRSEYRARHNANMPLEAAGMTWTDGTRWEIYLPYKTTQADNRLINMWALGHEMAHVLPVANPDGVKDAGFYI